jgi:monofunctional biosynthetic peptidoglycan transglycosylase
MERSDPPRTGAADPAAAKPEPRKPAVDGVAASQADAPPVDVAVTEAPSPPESHPIEPFPEGESEALERTHFEELERETTQPVRPRFTYQPSSAHDVPADACHAVNDEVPAESIGALPEEAAAENVIEPWLSVVEPSTEAPPAEETMPTEPQESAGEPWPDDAETTRPLSFEQQIAEAIAEQSAAPEPLHFETLPVEAPAIEPPSEPHSVEPQYSEFGAPEQVAPQQVGPEPPYPEPVAPEPVQADTYHPEPEPAPEAPPRTLNLQHDIADAWAPPASRAARTSWSPLVADIARPNYAPSAPVEQPPATRIQDLVRRGARVAALVFGGWFIAVLLLIVAFRFINPPFSMLMALRWVGGTPIHKQWVPIERISPNLTRAVIVSEDGRFCQHWGIDFVEAAKAIQRATDGYPRGASTITMQVAKNLFLLPAKSYLRKLVEIPLTFAIELAWPKRRILEVYLNIVELGPGIFGAEAAAQAHFRRSAIGLTSRQAAQLAVALPNPIVRDAGDPGPRTAHRASVIQARAARTREASACVDGGG